MTGHSERVRRRIRWRVTRRMAPTLGAIVLFLVLAGLLGWSDYERRQDIADARAEAVVTVCEQSNGMRRAVRTTNAIVVTMLEGLTGPRPPEYRRAREQAIAHLEANPSDPVARLAVVATRSSSRTRQVAAAARGALRLHSAALAPVACRELPAGADDTSDVSQINQGGP